MARTLQQQILSGIGLTFCALIIPMILIRLFLTPSYEAYRNKARCMSLVIHEKTLDQVSDERFEEKISSDTKRVTFVHPSKTPFARYWCTVKVKDGVVIEGESSRHWGWRW